MSITRSLPAAFVAAFCCVSGFAADPIAPQDFAELHALIKPATSEWKWAAIPWQTSLWEARRKAAEEGKPILLWEMDGNPLGCT